LQDSAWPIPGRHDFETLPADAQSIFLGALTIAADGGKADIAKPLHGIGAGVFEIALAFRGDALRVVYSVQLGDEIWVIHAFQKKSKQGARTPGREIALVRDRSKRLKDALS
jgi:phage-related protein